MKNYSLRNFRQNHRRRFRGIVTLEMIILTPIFLTLILGVVELTQALQANNIVINIGREGANLASRSRSEAAQDVMRGLALSAQPLDMQTDGMIYVTVVVGSPAGNPFVLEQHRYLDAGLASRSRIWAGCGSWDANGSCAIPNANRPRVAGFPMALDDGEATYVVEVFYNHELISNFVLADDIEIYSRSFM